METHDKHITQPVKVTAMAAVCKMRILRGARAAHLNRRRTAKLSPAITLVIKYVVNARNMLPSCFGSDTCTHNSRCSARDFAALHLDFTHHALELAGQSRRLPFLLCGPKSSIYCWCVSRVAHTESAICKVPQSALNEELRKSKSDSHLLQPS